MFKWIDVNEEEKPGAGELVLVAGPLGPWTVAEWRTLNGAHWADEEGYSLLGVEFWMRIPPVPETK